MTEKQLSEQEKQTEEKKLKEVLELVDKQLEQTEQIYERLEKTTTDEFLLNQMRKNAWNKNKKLRKCKTNAIFCKN
ncbi:MAG: hypothetical protein IJV31_10365 [Clostridia bacterium]|nr:hypothetical protein [Clostridia bacterium]